MDNPEEMDKFLEICNLPRLELGEITSNFITSNKIESAINQLPPTPKKRTKAQDHKSSQVNSTKHLEMN